MNKKGFTLVELLAVIVILAIIALIATPIILNVIGDAKEKAALESFKGYMDAAEKAILLNELEEIEGFPTTEDGCYTLNGDNGLDKYIEVKGTRPIFDEEGAKICITNGNVTSSNGLIVDGYKISVTTQDGKLVYSVDGKVIEETKNEETKNLTGIPSKDYTVGDKLEEKYLGYSWIVMKDNGTSTQLVMDGYLSSDELTANLPSDIASSNVSSSDAMRMCVYDSTGSSNYCNSYNSSTKGTWNRSIVKPTIEKWLDSKMTEKGLTKITELVGMAFNDGVETINSYVRIPTKEELIAIDKACEDGTTGNPYCADTNNYMFTEYSYWLVTSSGTESWYAFKYYNNSDYGIGGGAFAHFSSDTAKVRPVITVNEK